VNAEKVPREIEEGTIKVPESWPQKGQVEIDQVVMRYRPNLPTVLNNLSLKIEPGLKIGVVGRTSAGKSTLGQLLLRICEVDSG
jgi:ATP-binding cassette, subfamily C (CFTR/MRP), member 1